MVLKILKFIALILIKIGDGMIFLLKLPFVVVKFVTGALFFMLSFILFLLSFLLKAPWFLLLLVIKEAKLTFSFVKRVFLFLASPLFSFVHLGKNTRVSIHPVVVKQPVRKPPRKIKTLVAFQLLTLGAKLKYFFLGLTFALFFIYVPLLIALYIHDLPNPKELSFQEVPQTTKIYDRNGILLYQIYANQNRTIVALSDIPQTLQKATIATEDKDFYNHPGFDASAIIRAIVANASGKSIQGGSTITQQLMKTALLTSEQTYSRKFKEIILAFLTERIYTKQEILEMYFTHVPYGGTAWGVEAASELYFDKSVKDLDLAQSAFLAGMPGAPSVYSPYGSNPTLWKKRQTEVLDRMLQLGYITTEQLQQAKDEELTFIPKKVPLRAPHFVMYVRDLLIQKYGINAVERGGLSVITSLDLKTQDMAQQVVTEEVQNDANLNLTNGAALITNPKNGDVLAMVGSADFDSVNGGNVNVTTARRQPGSSIKPVTYSAALQKGYTAATIIDDSPVAFPSISGSYAPVNYDGKFHGRIPLRQALGNSMNIPAVRTLNSIGIPTMVGLAQKMGIKTWGPSNKYGLSITLGSAEVTMTDMATVYGVFANHGERIDLNPLLKVIDYKGNVLEEKITDSSPTTAATGQEVIRRKVLDEGVAFIISDILADNQARTLEFGPSSPLNIPGKRVSVKTGTTDNKRDNWTIGYIPNRLVAVWVGNNDNSPMSPTLASGITGAAPIWNRIMVNLLSSNPDGKISSLPANIIKKPCLGRMEYFIKGTENSVYCLPLIIPTPTATPTP